MIHDVAVKIGTKTAEIAESNETEKYELIYAFERLANYLLLIFLLAALSIPLHLGKPVLIIMFTFMPIRLRFGGSHVKSDYLCLFLTVTIPVIIAYLTRLIDFNFITMVGVYVVAYIMAIGIGVVDNPNKRLSQEKKKKLQKQGLIFLTIILIINLLFYFKGVQSTSDAILTGVIIGFVNLLFGK